MKNAKRYLSLSFIIIAVLFFTTFGFIYHIFRQQYLITNTDNQIKMAAIINQSLDLYFDKLRFIVENAVLNPVFWPENAKKDDQIRFDKINVQDKSITTDIKVFLEIHNKPVPRESIKENEVYLWQIYKGLPEVYGNKVLVAKDRRVIARNILRSFKDVHYVFEMDINGDLIFLEPFDTQKNVSSFNYKFRDYLNLVKKHRATIISEGYISHDFNKTQIITVATPVFDKTGSITKVFAISISANTLSKTIFTALHDKIGLDDKSSFYLVDRHGHIVASSSGKNVYLPIQGAISDNKDTGNIRNLPLLDSIDWYEDILEKGNLWERKTESWQILNNNNKSSKVYTNLDDSQVLGTFYPFKIIDQENFNWGILIETPLETLQSIENSLKLYFLIAGIILLSILITLFWIIKKSLKNLESQILIKEQEISSISSQLAHDIRSPIAVLKSLQNDILELPDISKRSFQMGLNRIEEITYNLLKNHKKDFQSNAEIQSEELLSLIESVISEKRIEFYSKTSIRIIGNFDESSYGLFSRVQRGKIKSILSNLINNSVESISKDKGSITISLRKKGNCNVVSVADNGIGIEVSLIPTIFTKGFTTKTNGNGLGLSNAKEEILKLGGNINCSSNIDKGTIFDINLPSSQISPTHIEFLPIYKYEKIIVLDDDPSFHEVWKRKFTNLTILVEHFTSVHALLEKYKSLSADSLLLCDFELMDKSYDGIKIILNYGHQDHSVLVTARSEETIIQERCATVGIKILPKTIINFVPVKSQPPLVVLIDDDKLIHLSWISYLEERNYKILTYFSVEDFLNSIDSIRIDSLIFVDSNLQGVKGEIESEKIFNRGYKYIYLTTGYNQDQLLIPSWVRKVYPKNPNDVFG